MHELVQITTLLNKALLLLSEESNNKEKHIESLQRGQRADLTKEFPDAIISF